MLILSTPPEQGALATKAASMSAAELHRLMNMTAVGANTFGWQLHDASRGS